MKIDAAVITEQGMQSDTPLVDFQMTDAAGTTYFAVLTGDLVLGLSDAIKGVNLRLHDMERPS